MNRYGFLKRMACFLMAVMIVAGSAGKAAADTEESAAAAEAASEGTVAEIQTAAAAETPEATTADGTTPSADVGSTVESSGSTEAPEDHDLLMDGYEIHGVEGNRDDPDVLRKGRQAKLVVYVKSQNIMTKEISKGDISVTKLHDSFRISGNPKIKVTSEKEENLEFTVTFPKVTYSGKGDLLKFRVSYKKTGIPSGLVSVNIAETEESGHSDRGSVEDVSGQPAIKIRRISPQTEIGQGETFTLVLELENTSSDADIEDLTVNINPGTAMFITEDTNSRLVKRLDTKKTAEVRLNMKAGQEFAGPVHELEVDLKYNYYSGGSLTGGSSVQKVLIPVKNGPSSGQPLIRISRGEIPGPINAGQAFNMILRLENTSNVKTIHNLLVIFEPNDQISLLEQSDTRQMGDLAAGQVVEIPVRLKAGDELANAASQLLGLSLKFDYDSDKGNVQGTYGEKIVIPTAGSQGKTGSPTPNIIISNYTYGDRISAGQIFDLEMELENTSSQQPVENVVVSLDTGEGISINSSSNTFYLPRMEAGGKKKTQVKVQALFQSKLQSPKITISIKYEYVDKKERRQTTSSETIAIPVYQPDRFELKPPVYSENLTAGEEGTLSIPYVNKGRGQIFNVEALLECDITALEKNVTVGNFESGKSGTLDFVITPQRAGQFEGNVQITYEDEAMQGKTVTVPVKFDVLEAQVMDKEAGSEADTGAGGTENGWKKLAAAAFFVSVVLIVAAAGRKKRRKNSQEVTEVWEDEVHEEEDES